jgi:hypothetical protein
VFGDGAAPEATWPAPLAVSPFPPAAGVVDVAAVVSVAADTAVVGVPDAGTSVVGVDVLSEGGADAVVEVPPVETEVVDEVADAVVDRDVPS